ncbi:hypothetical protein D0U04_24345 [Bacillus clarus]|uniref:Putative phage replication protein n=1 Tax=Bacillus clarus TaxID=2338372 RepID=A0A090YYT2_9BACI|nr:hypothetical protein [Bacillus clarus]KFN04109.1 putative phage replication protein [Bacillus clarus]RFT63596.1 hypothetical protein D0U04_24345 [Bacillus clarus]
MAVYRNMQVSFWQDEFILDLTPEERYFYIYLLTGTKTKQCGIYILPKRLAELETGYSMETVEKLVNRFVEYGKILYDAETKELFIINWLSYNPILNTNIEKCVLRELKTVKNKEFVHMFLRRCLEEELNIPLLLECFGMPDEEVELISKKVLQVCEDDEEEVEKVEAEINEVNPSSNVFMFYEQNFGSLSSYAAEELSKWGGELQEDFNEVEEATAKFRKKETSFVCETEKFLVEYEEWERNVPCTEEILSLHDP